MYWQQRYLEQNRAFPALSGLATIELPNKGLLGCIQLQAMATAGATEGDRDFSVLDGLEKVEVIVNGSQIVKSLTGREIKAMMMYQKMSQGQGLMCNYLSHANRVELFINLGRHYHDLDYMLDLSKVSDPELRIEYDWTATSHHGWTNGEAHTGTAYRDVICHLLRESDITPKGYIKQSEIARFLWASGRQQNLVVPRGPTYSNLYVESYYKQSGLSFSLDTIEVNINSDDRIPLRLSMQEFIDIIEAQYGRFEMWEVKDVDFVSLVPSLLEVGHTNQETWGAGVALIFDKAALWGQQLGIGVYDADGNTYQTAKKIQIEYDGILPFSVAAIPIFNPWDDRTWIKTAELGDFWVRYECSATGDTSCVIKLLGDEVVAQ